MRSYSITKKIKDSEYMEIEVKYDAGDGYMNPRRGYYIYFTRVEYLNGFKKFTPSDNTNFKIFIKEVKRYSYKQMKKIIAYLFDNREYFFEVYYTNDIPGIYLLLKGLK